MAETLNRGLIERARAYLFGEQGKARATISTVAQKWPAVQDDLTTKRGIDIYESMRYDPDVRSALFILYAGVLANGYEVGPNAKETDEQYTLAQEQSDYIRACFEDMQGSLEDVLEEIARDGLGSGTSIAERVYELRADGRIGYRAIKPKNPALYEFELDQYNNVTALWLSAGSAKEKLDPSKFPVFAYQPEHGQPWGTSVLRAAYKWWWAKQQIAGFWWCFLEKYGMPTATGTFKRGTPKDQQDELLRVLNSIQQETALVIPEDVTVALLEAARTGNDGGFQDAIEYCGKQIVKAIIGQTLTTDEGTRVGSMALGKVHQDVLAIFVKHLKRNLEEYTAEEIIRPAVDLNFAEPLYPTFSLQIDDSDVTAISEMLFRASQNGVIDPERDEADNQTARELLGLPVRTQDSWKAIEARKEADRRDFERRIGLGVGGDEEE